MQTETQDAQSVAANPSAIVPLRRQYLQIKARFPDTILLFRLGDFYETFEADAEVAARVLDIVLTGREMGKGLRVPMAGIPHHSADGYIARLIAAGHKVAICEQIGEPQKGRGLVERDVTRVVTPGTLLDPTMLDAKSHNFIAAVAVEGNRTGVASADISTGVFQTTELSAGSREEAILAAGRELLRLGPAEVLLPANAFDDAPIPLAAWLPERATTSKTEPWRWKSDRAGDALRRHFEVESLAGFGCEGKPLATAAAGALLQYLADTQLSGLKQITALSTYEAGGFMTLDAQTRRNLELTESSRGERRHSLVAVLDQTRTPMGARLLRSWVGQPLLDVDQIRERQRAVGVFYADALCRADLRVNLGSIGDIERLANRVVIGTAGPRELSQLRSSLDALPRVVEAAASIGLTIPDCEEITRLLHASIVDEPPATIGRGAAIRGGFSPELDGHQVRARDAREWIANLERTERERTGIKSLKVGYNKVFGYYLEITSAALAAAERDRAVNGIGEPALPVDYIPKQSLANATRYFTPQLKEYETVVLTAQETLAEIESDVYRRVLAEISGSAERLLTAARAVAQVDVISTLAEVAVQRSYTCPDVDDSGVIDVEEGRHPTLEAILPRGEFVPNDALLSVDDDQVLILTGPNMAGKSSWLRQVALIVLLAQIGSYVPAKRARIGLVDRIFTRIGAQDDIATGQSTFMVEMLETANILHHATSQSLVVLDEIGRGTSTYDGLAIARAIVEYIHNTPRLGCRTLFATHYHELTELEQVLPRVRCYRMDVLEEGERVVFLRQVVPGGADRSYGVHVAQLAGIPRGVVRRAREILSELEASGHASLDRARRRDAMSTPPTNDASFQLTLFGAPNPLVEELKALDIESLSPLEAITKLFELQRRANTP